MPESATVEQEVAAIEAVRRMHTNPNSANHGWPDYAYHFTVFASGRAYYTGDIETWRYVAAGGNHETIGLAMPGDFTDSPPGDRHLAAVRGLVGEILYALDGWSDDRRKRGAMIVVVPHRHYGGTACPGNTWPAWAGAVTIDPPAGSDVPSAEDQRQQDADLIEATANEYAIDPVHLLALAMGEAEPMAGRLFHPWSRRPADPALDPVSWPDVSAGAWHQTVRYSPEYVSELLPVFGGAYPGPEHTERIMLAYLDPAYAAGIAAGQLAEHLGREGEDFVRAACRYNKPGLDPALNPARVRYAQCYDRAKAIWAALGR